MVGTDCIGFFEIVNQIHKNKTCFIVGAGPSLISQDVSKLVTKNTFAIAVNSGYLAYKEADYFLSDDRAVRYWSYYFQDLKESRTTTPVLFEKMLGDTSHWFQKKPILFRHKEGYELTDHYDHNDKKFHIWEARTSVGSAIHIAHVMGAKEIVLFGVDCCRLNGCRYFWQHPSYKNKPFRNDRVRVDAYKRKKVEGKESDSDLESHFEYWNMVSEKMDQHGIKVYNASNISLLKCFDPYVKFEHHTCESRIERDSK